MNAKSILIWCVIGLIAGWLASFVVGGGGLVRYLLTGLVGAFVGGFLVRSVGIKIKLGHPLVDEVVVAALGAVIVVLIARLLA